jgi:hypothetical protein
MSVYIQRFEGEWVDVTEERFLACCDCGLIHKEEYRIVPSENGDHIFRRVFRDNQATANRRRSMKAKKEGLWAKLKRK